MKVKLTITGLLLALCFSFCIAQKSLPSIEVKTLDGKSINVLEYAKNGKITILSFWATWCTPCKKELDAFAEMYEDWQADYDVEVVAITIDTRRALAKVRPMVEMKGWPFEVLSDSAGLLKDAMNFQTIPQTFILNQKGEIAYSHNGYVPGDEEEVEATIAELSNSSE